MYKHKDHKWQRKISDHIKCDVPANINPEENVKYEQLKMLYSATPLATLATIINAAVLTTVEWDMTEHTLLIIWVISLMLVTLARFGLAIAYNRVKPNAPQTPLWEQRFNLGTITAGIIWGSASLLIFPESSITHQAFLAFVIGGMCAGAVSSLSPRLLPLFSFVLLGMIPLIAHFLLIGTAITNAMAAMLLLFLATILASGLRIYKNIRQNIDLRMQSEASTIALAESEGRFRELFEGNKSVELIIDPTNGCIIETNHAAEKFYGYTRNQLIHMKISDINTHSEDNLLAKMELGKTEMQDHFLFEHRLANGELRDVEVYSGPIDWNKQRVLYSIIHDVSTRKRAETLVNNTSNILEMVTTGKPVNTIYDSICKMHESLHPRMRASILKLQGNQLFHCSGPSLPAEYLTAINGVQIGPVVGSCGTAAFLGKELIVEDIANDPLWADYKEVALPHNLRACWSEPIIGIDGNILGTFAMYFDETSTPSDLELKEIRDASKLVAIVMEKARKESMLLKLSQAIEQAGESIIITDKLGVIEYVNTSFTKITGYTSAEVLGKNPRLLKSGQHSSEYYRRLYETITNGGTWQHSIMDRRKDGREYPSLMTISPITDSDGAISHYVGIQQDMSEHNLLEEQLRQAQKMESLGTLVGGIAHDFNNMLAGMTGNIYLAKKKVADLPDVLKKLTTVEELSFRAASMIQQLLTFARKGQVNMNPFGLTSFMKEATKLSQTSIPENIKFRSDFCATELVIKGDATQLQQVIMNILNNARDAVGNAQNPEITLKVEEFRADAYFASRHDDLTGELFAHLSIEDNGSGISKDAKQHIFEPFYSTKEVGMGTGLGLSMAYGAIQGHNGAIEMESMPGKTVFHIYLPLIEEKGFDLSIENQINLLAGQGELILIVDDNANVRATDTEVLQEIGYSVQEAIDGLDAIEKFKAHRQEIALIIMDVVMPRMGGVIAAERIKLIDPTAKIIFATGYDKDSTLNKDMPSKANVVLSKPYNIIQLSRAIRELLDS